MTKYIFLFLLLIVNCQFSYGGDCSHFLTDQLGNQSVDNSFYGTITYPNGSDSVTQGFTPNYNSYRNPHTLLQINHNFYGMNLTRLFALSVFGECVYAPYPFRYCSRLQYPDSFNFQTSFVQNADTKPKLCIYSDPIDRFDFLPNIQPFHQNEDITNLGIKLEMLGISPTNTAFPEILGQNFSSIEIYNVYKYLIDTKLYNTTQYNMCSATQSNSTGTCLDLPIAPKPPRYKSDSFITEPLVLVERICAQGETSGYTNYCTISLNGTPSTYSAPGFKVTLLNYSNFIPNCSIYYNNGECMQFLNLSNYTYPTTIPYCAGGSNITYTCAIMNNPNSALAAFLSSAQGGISVVYTPSYDIQSITKGDLNNGFVMKALGVMVKNSTSSFFEGVITYTKTAAGYMFDSSSSNHQFSLSIGSDNGQQVTKNFSIMGFENKFCVIENASSGYVIHKCIPKSTLPMVSNNNNNVTISACTSELCKTAMTHTTPSVLVKICDPAFPLSFNESKDCQKVELSIGGGNQNNQFKYIYDKPIFLIPFDSNNTIPDQNGTTCPDPNNCGGLNLQNFIYVGGATKVCIYGLNAGYGVMKSTVGAYSNIKQANNKIIYYPSISADDILAQKTTPFAVGDIIGGSFDGCFATGKKFDFTKCTIGPLHPLQATGLGLCVDVPPPSSQ